jgi:hypothetical protein
MTAPQPPAPAGGEAPGAGLPTSAFDALHALADRWDADRRGFEHYARLWRERGDAVLEATAAGRVRQLADCARDLRNTLNDLLKESDMEAVIYTTPLTDGQNVQRAGLKTATPGLVVDLPVFPCDNDDPCWTVLHARSGRPFPFCWETRDEALTAAEKYGEHGPWQFDEATMMARAEEMKTPLTRIAKETGASLHDFGPVGPGGIDNGTVA